MDLEIPEPFEFREDFYRILSRVWISSQEDIRGKLARAQRSRYPEENRLRIAPDAEYVDAEATYFSWPMALTYPHQDHYPPLERPDWHTPVKVYQKSSVRPSRASYLPLLTTFTAETIYNDMIRLPSPDSMVKSYLCEAFLADHLPMARNLVWYHSRRFAMYSVWFQSAPEDSAKWGFPFCTFQTPRLDQIPLVKGIPPIAGKESAELGKEVIQEQKRRQKEENKQRHDEQMKARQDEAKKLRLVKAREKRASEPRKIPSKPYVHTPGSSGSRASPASSSGRGSRRGDQPGTPGAPVLMSTIHQVTNPPRPQHPPTQGQPSRQQTFYHHSIRQREATGARANPTAPRTIPIPRYVPGSTGVSRDAERLLGLGSSSAGTPLTVIPTTRTTQVITTARPSTTTARPSTTTTRTTSSSRHHSSSSRRHQQAHPRSPSRSPRSSQRRRESTARERESHRTSSRHSHHRERR